MLEKIQNQLLNQTDKAYLKRQVYPTIVGTDLALLSHTQMEHKLPSCSAAEALVTENAARLALMQQAEQSVDDRLDALSVGPD